MVGPPCSAQLCGGFFCASRIRQPHRGRAPTLGLEESMDGATIFVVVIVALFLGAMIGMQVYIHTGKKENEEERRGDDTRAA